MDLLAGIKVWIYGAVALVILTLGGLFVWRGVEIANLKQSLQAAQNQAIAATEQVGVLTRVRAQEVLNQKKANDRAEKIRKAPAADDGPVSRILADSLSRLR